MSAWASGASSLRSQWTWLPRPDGHAVGEDLDDAAERVALLGRRLDLVDHGLLGRGVEAADRRGVDPLEVGGRGALRRPSSGAGPIWTTCRARRRRACASSALASMPAATRAAVSRAEARSSTSRASVKPYFCMPARSAWPGRGWVSGALGPPGRRPSPRATGRSAVPLGVADLDRDRRAERAAVADPADQRHLVLLEPHPRPAAVAEPAAGQLALDLLDGDGSPAGRPSTTTTRPRPCDSPAVRKRSTDVECTERPPTSPDRFSTAQGASCSLRARMASQPATR